MYTSSINTLTSNAFDDVWVQLHSSWSTRANARSKFCFSEEQSKEVQAEFRGIQAHPLFCSDISLICLAPPHGGDYRDLPKCIHFLQKQLKREWRSHRGISLRGSLVPSHIRVPSMDCLWYSHGESWVSVKPGLWTGLDWNLKIHLYALRYAITKSNFQV